ncbi:MAG TPA: outer membrane beta-barrel protein [Verrucomicrobiae bacterium]|nr:outer membrane beta-barrel protein [Verrucomicrobiae bacterium]
MRISRLISWAALLTAIGMLSFHAASYAADPLRPDASEQVSLLRPHLLIPSWRIGPFDLRPSLSAGGTYDDNITLGTDGSKLSDMIWTITPALTAVADNTMEGYGTLLSLQYSPSFLFFTRHSDNDNVDQHASLEGSWTMAKLSLGLKERFDETKTGIIEVGERLRQRTYYTELDSRYKLGDRTSVEMNPRLTISETEHLIGYTEWGVDGFLNRELSSKITGGVGGSAGYVDPSDGPVQTYERLLGRLMYALTGKVEVDANGGVEWRDFHSHQSTSTIPVFGIGAAYHPFEGTTLSLEAGRRDEISGALTNEDYTASTVSLAVRQRVLTDRLHVSFTGSYENRDYHASAEQVSGSRTDDFYLLRTEVELSLVRHFTVSAFYQYETDSSSVPARRFSDNQFGFQGTWKL